MNTTFETVALIHVRNKRILLVSSRGREAFYLPGGKMNAGETYEEALIREVKEEVSVDLVPESIKLFGIFEALAHDRPEGVRVRMRCYTAEFENSIKKSGEIDRMEFFNSAEFFSMNDIAPAVKLVVENLEKKGLID